MPDNAPSVKPAGDRQEVEVDRRENEPTKAERKPTWQCEFCGRFYSVRTAKDHAYCIQAYDRECFERAYPYG